MTDARQRLFEGDLKERPELARALWALLCRADHLERHWPAFTDPTNDEAATQILDALKAQP